MIGKSAVSCVASLAALALRKMPMVLCSTSVDAVIF